ncbi:uncharacterized protein VP01_1923g7 [Puccinia sorghi]|uniref:Uncharacterized protein n=1 Tax=Puccinia sorghi TaxID=27349 RepID=A0A0L6VEF0_9BASI|nr:uncharacterized protein VP01_1923g7 [Puccinia sorghi]
MSYRFAEKIFQKHQNHLAAMLTDVVSSKADTGGLHLIQLLCASPPPPDSAHIFLPQQRAVFLLQAVNRHGSHWDQMINLINIKLDVGSIMGRQRVSCISMCYRRRLE